VTLAGRLCDQDPRRRLEDGNGEAADETERTRDGACSGRERRRVSKTASRAQKAGIIWTAAEGIRARCRLVATLRKWRQMSLFLGRNTSNGPSTRAPAMSSIYRLS